MKKIIILAFVITFQSSLQNTFASTNTIQKANIFSQAEIDSLRNSVDRVLPEFKEFQQKYKGESSYSLYLSNSCYKEIVAYVRYMDLDSKWIDDGFWKLPTNKETYVGETRNAFYYPGAFSTDETLVWGDIAVVFKGYDLFVSEKKITATKWGDWVNEFSCDKTINFLQ
ncbi:MAG: hypothetical protein Q7U04_15100 [Bacteriovorax sp.]|nr:hypothetical protein [Bacteriovorax sp.]